VTTHPNEVEIALKLLVHGDGSLSGASVHSKPIPGEIKMKMRTLAALTAMALATTLAACGQQSQPAADKAKESAPKAAEAPKAPEPAKDASAMAPATPAPVAEPAKAPAEAAAPAPAPAAPPSNVMPGAVPQTSDKEKHTGGK
jgi:hypothetical protein